MLSGKKLWLAFVAGFFIIYVIYACKSVKQGGGTSRAQQPSVLLFKKSVGDHPDSIGNRTPIAKITITDSVGRAPFTVAFKSKNIYDHDEKNPFSYQWILNKKVISTEPNPTYTFQNNGIYHVVLKVSDDGGKSNTDTVEIKVGNAVPTVTIHVTDNNTFFFDKPTTFRYAVEVHDNKDNVINRENLRVTMRYITKVASNVSLTGYPPMENYNYGRNLIAASDCKSCHQSMGRSTVPSFMQISEKYMGNNDVIGSLANKIITGGSGVWGEQVMSAHSKLSKEDATEIVKYVLSVAEKPEMEIPQEGAEVLNEHIGTRNGGRYVFTASYTDKGGALTPLTGRDVMVLRPSKVEAELADVIYDIQQGTSTLDHINNKSYFVLKNIDLRDVHRLIYCYSSKESDAKIEVHINAYDGQLISTATCKTTGAWDKYEEVSATVTDPGGKHDLYFVFAKNDAPNKDLTSLDWIKFDGGNEVKVIDKTSLTKTKLVRSNISKKNTSAKSNTANANKIIGTEKSLGRILIAKSDCYSCHKINQKLVGPAYSDVAKRYKNQAAAVNSLVNKILKGGAGNWGQVPMTPHPQLSKKDAAKMVQFILSLRK